MPEIHPLLRDRWSSRSLDPTHVLGEDELRLLLEAARWSPSAGNSQPWAFLVLRRGEPGHAAFLATLSRGNVGWVPAASAVVVTLYRTGHEDDPSFTYSDYAEYDLGQAAAHLTVQASALGLMVHQFAGFDHDQVAEAFDVPPWWRVTTAIAVGRYADPEEFPDVDPALRERDDKPRVRNELSTFVFGDTFGTPRWP